MKIPKEQVEKLSRLLLEKLKERGLLVFKAPEEKVLAKMIEVVVQDLRAEDALDREVEEILKSHSGELDSGRVDYRRMFNMVKGKLARERGIVL